MTMTNDRRKEYPGNGEARFFSGPRAYSAAHLELSLTNDATGESTPITSGFTITGIGAKNTTVALDTPHATGTTLLILRVVPYGQDADITSQGPYNPKYVEDALDFMAMQIQQLADGVERSFRAPDTSPGVVPIANIPNRYVVTDNDGNPAAADSPPTADLTMRGDVASDAAGKGTDMVGVRDTIAPTYLKTLSQMLDGMPISLFRFINPLQHAGIRAGTSTYDASDDINTALAAYKNLRHPGGKIMLGSTLLLQDRTSLIGECWSAPYSGGTVLAPSGSVFKLLPGANCDVFRQAAKATRYSLFLQGFAIDGDGANQSSNVGPDGTYGMYQFNRNAFFLEALYNATFDHVMAYNMRGAGWAYHGDGAVGMTNVFMRDCRAFNCRTYGIYGEGSLTDLRINNGDYGFGRVANLRLTSSATVDGAVFWTSQCQDPTDPATHATGTGAVTNGGVVIAGDSNKLNGCRIEGNAGHGVKIVGDNNRVSSCTIYANSFTAGTGGLFDGINDAGDNNVFDDLDIRQSPSSALALRKAIKLEAAHAGTRIRGGNMARVGANAAIVTLPVQGLTFAGGNPDKSDFTWASGQVSAYSAVANSIGTSFTKVQFRTETADTRNEWSVATDDFTAAEAGIYRIESNVTIANVTDANSFILAVFKNGVEYRRCGQQRAGAAQSIAGYVSMELKLEAGDVIDIRGICGTATNTSVGAAITWVEITQING